MRVFLDASAMVPLVVERDQWVLPLRRHLRALRQQRCTFMTSNWTYYEALAIVQRAHHILTLQLRRMLEPMATIEPVSLTAEAEALRRFFAWADKTASVVDHANLLMAEALGCDAILSFDDDFVQIATGTGIRVLR
jgi:predicted nucleic acid-binding protein